MCGCRCGCVRTRFERNGFGYDDPMLKTKDDGTHAHKKNALGLNENAKESVVARDNKKKEETATKSFHDRSDDEQDA